MWGSNRAVEITARYSNATARVGMTTASAKANDRLSDSFVTRRSGPQYPALDPAIARVAVRSDGASTTRYVPERPCLEPLS